jgi:aminoglycoside phosphotransferase (APT) family kinase protein
MSAPGRLLPDSERLLHGIKTTLQRVGQGVFDDATRNSLATVECVLNELLSRQQHAFYVSFHQSALALLRKGFQLSVRSKAAGAHARLRKTIAALPKTLASDADFSVLSVQISRVMAALVQTVKLLRQQRSVTVSHYLQQVVAKEQELMVQGQKHAVQPPAAATSQAAAASVVLTRESFEQYLQLRFPERPGLHVTDFRQLVGGYQKTTILFAMEDHAGKRDSLVIRAEKADRFVTLDAGDVCSEYEIVRLAYAAGIVVAEPMWLEPNAKRLGQKFFVSRKVEGDNYGTAIAAAQPLTNVIAQEFIKTLATIHAVPINAAFKSSPIGRWAKHATVRASTAANVAYWLNQPWLAAANPSPVLWRLKTWLEDNVPPDLDKPCLVHCDFGVHNFLVRNGKISGVLDWEAARIGDPAEDIAWCLQSSAGKINGPLALRWYQEFTGRRVSEYRLRYYDVFSTMKVMVGASCAAALYQATPDAAIEWCNIPFLWAPLMASTVAAKIAAAEAVRA